MTWYAVYEKSTGKLTSVGTVVADPMPAELEAKQLTGRPTGNVVWNKTNLEFEAGPTVKQAWERFTEDEDVVAIGQSLTAAERLLLRQKLIEYFGGLI